MDIQSERGAVALITTIIISLLLAIITTGLIGTMSSELRQQDDSEQSTLAYYAAQAGVEDAVNKIRAALPAVLQQPDCGQNMNLDKAGTNTIGWTCQLIITSGEPKGILTAPEQAVQVNPGEGPSTPAYDSVVVRWDVSANAIGSAYFNPPALSASPASWVYAPPFEVAITEYKKNGFAAGNTADISLRNALFLPSFAGGSGVNFGNIPTGKDLFVGQNPVRIKCVRNGSYNCNATISGLNPAKAYLFRIRSRYTGTSYQMSFYNGGVLQSVPDGTATIDVTAKAGDAYRRVIYQVPYKQGAAQGLDYVIYSDKDICKEFQVFDKSIYNGANGCSP